MKKVHMMFGCFLLTFIFIFVGCNKNNEKEIINIDSNENGELTENDNEQGKNDDSENEKVINKDSVNTQKFAIIVDNSLTGIELIKAAKTTNPVGAIIYDMKTVIWSNDTKYETVGTMIKSGKNFKTKTESQEEGAEVTIYNADEQMTYKYFEARKQGYKYKDELTGLDRPTLEGEYDLTMLYAEAANLSKAEVIDYEGEQVIYFEIFEGNNKIASWISLRYGIAIKTEMYDGETLVTQTTINNISLPASILPSTFLPPSDIILEDYSSNNDDGFEEQWNNNVLIEDSNDIILTQ
ncbi:MAG: hypothetical protein CVV02_15500 [Firmicutes bacterium HGW-Firmicutes-7]|nr:MAG: hypothetical protein CVV02_15500 [Firmicutes bacterium HGW-Firmicutes-7]